MADHRFLHRSRMPVSAETLYAWHEKLGAFERLSPPWQRVELRRHEGVRNGKRAELRVYAGPFYRTWVAEHRDCEPGRQFRDVQIRGPFGAWSHVHAMIPDGAERSFLEDRITYSLPFDRLLNPLFGRAARSSLERLFRYRHRIVAHDLEIHQRFGGRSLRIAVTGSTGFLGRRLCAFLRSGGHEVLPVVRTRPDDSSSSLFWDPESRAIDADRLEGLDAVVHLAGENPIGLFWSRRKRERIRRSRVDGTRFLAETLAGLNDPPGVLISASGVGVYGDRGEATVDERTPAGAGFMASVAQEWEAAASPASEAGIRVVLARLGAVLSPDGGALQFILPWFRAGLGASLTGADPYVSWIAPEDFAGAVAHMLLNEDLQGPVNVVAPQPETLRTVARTIGGLLARPVVLRVPSAVLRSALGVAAREMFLTSIRATPRKLVESDFEFRYWSLYDALAHVLGRS